MPLSSVRLMVIAIVLLGVLVSVGFFATQSTVNPPTQHGFSVSLSDPEGDVEKRFSSLCQNKQLASLCSEFMDLRFRSWVDINRLVLTGDGGELILRAYVRGEPTGEPVALTDYVLAEKVGVTSQLLCITLNIDTNKDEAIDYRISACYDAVTSNRKPELYGELNPLNPKGQILSGSTFPGTITIAPHVADKSFYEITIPLEAISNSDSFNWFVSVGHLTSARDALGNPTMLLYQEYAPDRDSNAPDQRGKWASFP